MNSFGLLTKDVAAGLGALADVTGQRPSSLFEWNNEDEWYDRLMFDMNVLKMYNIKQSEAIKDGKNR